MKTRAIEWLFASMMMTWGAMLLLPGNMLAQPTFELLLAVAPERTWGFFSIAVGYIRVMALVINGHWRRSPILRMMASVLGMMWWTCLAWFYGLAMLKGAPPFPMYGCMFLFIFFEGYSAYRCGEDAAKSHSFRFACLVWMREKVFGALGNRSGTNALT
jgi:hypothetical protein